MKRHGNLWHLVIDPKNIEEAYRKAKKGKTWQHTVQRVENNKQEVLDDIRASLIDHSFTTSKYRIKKVYEPKERTIYVLPFAPDRIVQHSVMNIISPIWDRMFDDDSHACRPGRGQHSASRRVMQFIRQNSYVLQGDIKQFYPSIHHDTLIEIINRKIKDPNILWLLEDIIRSFPNDKNVPIGNLTSQWLGNLYMNEFDRFVRTEVCPVGYIRYNDDFLMFEDDKKELHKAQNLCRDFLKERLSLTLSKDRVYSTYQGIDFVGYRHFKNYVLVRKRTARRIKQRIKHLKYEFVTKQIEPKKARSVVASIIGWLKWANAYHFRQSLAIDNLQKEICLAIV